MAEKHTTRNHIQRVIGFSCLTIAMLLFTSWLYTPRNDTKDSGILYPEQRAFYSEPRNSIDLFILGDSSGYAGFSPMELWNMTGMTSWVASEPYETMSGANAMLHEVLSMQEPKVIFLDTNMLFSEKENSSTVIMNFLKQIFSVFQYHNRWKSMSPADIFQPRMATYHNSWKGQSNYSNNNAYTGKEWMTADSSVAEIPDTAKNEFYTFIDTCNQEGIRVVLIDIPNAKEWNTARHNAVQELADECKLTFIDLNIDPVETIDFDYQTDFHDATGEHLCCSGAKKVTEYLAKWLTAETNLPDHRNEKEYAQWNDDYLVYQKNCGLYNSGS